jgi:2-polyprenyl-3-methyl-5-hydroxy-6-metoxy-1,4-benzoquinol methylase
MTSLPHGVSVGEWNDALAREHDIDDYYARSNFLVRGIERRRLRLIRSLVAPVCDERILEVGCGGGHVLELFPECELVGVDVSEVMITKASNRLASLRVTLHEGDLATVALPAASFDAVICTEVLEHVVDPNSVLEAIVQVVKPGGRVVVTFPNDVMIARGKGILRRSGIGRLPVFKGIDWGGDDYHLHTWTVGEMRALLRRHFEVVREAHVPFRGLPVRCCFLVELPVG